MASLSPPQWLGLFYFVSEISLTLLRRATSAAKRADAGSMRLLWTVITISIVMSQLALALAPAARSPVLIQLRPWWVAVCVVGIAVRWWAILHLGRLFTVDVAIAADHYVVDDGPYRWVRHPSYTGALVSFLGYGLSTGNWLTLVLLVVPVTVAFLHRMTIEESALLAGLGEPYRAYVARTKRLVPFLY